MVSVSVETPEQTDRRLRSVIAAADLRVLPGEWGFHEAPLDQPPRLTAGVDNSGFVGWLATALKVELGTGVFVVCGRNSDRGGIYDYWGCPADLAGQAAAVIGRLRG